MGSTDLSLTHKGILITMVYDGLKQTFPKESREVSTKVVYDELNRPFLGCQGKSSLQWSMMGSTDLSLTHKGILIMVYDGLKQTFPKQSREVNTKVVYEWLNRPFLDCQWKSSLQWSMIGSTGLSFDTQGNPHCHGFRWAQQTFPRLSREIFITMVNDGFNRPFLDTHGNPHYSGLQ